MQGQRSIISSLAESVDFDLAPPPTPNAGGSQQIFWSEMRTSEENGFADFLHLNEQVSQETQIVSGWNMAESSSSHQRNDVLLSAPKMDHPWSSSPSQPLPRVDEADGLTLSRQYTSDVSPHRLNLNSGYMDHAADRTTSENEERGGCSVDGCRQSCKRKAIECGIGQSSSSSMFPPDSTQWPLISQSYDSNNLLISQSPSPRLGLGLRIPPESSQGDGSHRSFRLRINPSSHEASPRISVSPLSHQPPRLLPNDHYEFGTSGTPINNQHQPHHQPQPQPQPPLLMHPNMHYRTSLAPLAYGERNLIDNAVPLPPSEVRASPRNLIARSVTGGSRTIGSSSRGGLNSNPSPPWIPPQGSSRSSRRLAECVRRSLLSSSIAEQNDLRNPLHLRPSPEDPSHHLHRRSIPRSSWIERQGDGLLGISYPLRTFTQGNEGRSRHVSEQIRNMLDMMRRGEGLRLEDVMILDQSVFFGVSDAHDRHRDMRLDVDNMSYEELLALEERIGNVSTGLSEDAVVKLLKQRKYTDGEEEPCCVCQEDYRDGDDVGSLDCGHNFHKGCIKQWLMLKNWCPICKTTGLAT